MKTDPVSEAVVAADVVPTGGGDSSVQEVSATSVTEGASLVPSSSDSSSAVTAVKCEGVSPLPRSKYTSAVSCVLMCLRLFWSFLLCPFVSCLFCLAIELWKKEALRSNTLCTVNLCFVFSTFFFSCWILLFPVCYCFLDSLFFVSKFT